MMPQKQFAIDVPQLPEENQSIEEELECLTTYFKTHYIIKQTIRNYDQSKDTLIGNKSKVMFLLHLKDG